MLAETFLVAWRRWSEIPSDGEARLWLYGVARRTIANQQRAARRRDRLNERLRAELAEAFTAAPGSQQTDTEVIAALERLDASDREILELTSWEEMTPGQAARVLGISAVSARSRLHRARRRLRRELENPAEQGVGE